MHFDIYIQVHSAISCSPNILCLYTSIYPRFTYGKDVYGTCTKLVLSRLQSLQTRILKILIHKGRRDSEVLCIKNGAF